MACVVLHVTLFWVRINMVVRSERVLYCFPPHSHSLENFQKGWQLHLFWYSILEWTGSNCGTLVTRLQTMTEKYGKRFKIQWNLKRNTYIGSSGIGNVKFKLSALSDTSQSPDLELPRWCLHWARGSPDTEFVYSFFFLARKVHMLNFLSLDGKALETCSGMYTLRSTIRLREMACRKLVNYIWPNTKSSSSHFFVGWDWSSH